ncbi:hypothetical protein RJ639_022082 [Escallonia herrerae]|uniref:Nodulin-like domain-containing protein n=1 Tax=Escallonia herrerae TaxID=1293975 RepID=A0AA89AHE6_9ASTE|nr:hypothetical protein RJ639_022082 [Escallonia herrerae]
MMVHVPDKIRAFWNSRWLVFVASMWVQSCSGIGYLFGSISPVIKSAMGYNQRHVAMLGVAKDLGDAIGFVPGILCEIFPIWVVLCVGVVQNFVGYGVLWLTISQIMPTLPLWVVDVVEGLARVGVPREIAVLDLILCILIFVGTNGETYFNTGALVPCVQNFPKSRGPVVGILKGFAGLSGAILTQVYTMINAPSQASLIFMVAVGPAMVIIALMFIVRPVEGHRQVRPSDNSSFLFIYTVCLILAAYLLGVLLLEDLVSVNQTLITLLTVLLLILILLPIIIPVLLVLSEEPSSPTEESLLPEPEKQGLGKSEMERSFILSEVEDENSEVDLFSALERHKRIAHLQAKLFQAAAEGAVRVKRRKGPRRGEDFTLLQALKKADFWLIFFSLVLVSGSGLTVIDNLGQMCLSLGYSNTHIFVSMISIWNFLGRVGGGYFSELIIRCVV